MRPSAQDAAGHAEIHALVKRLARPHSSGGDVVERAALLASRSFEATTVWIADRGGVAEAMVSGTPRRGLHGPRLGLSGGTEPRTRCGSCCRPARWPEPSATREATDPDPVPGRRRSADRGCS